MAQKLTIESFVLDPNDITASTQLRNDANGDACALVKVLLATPGATFGGNTVGATDYNMNQYLVYMTSGSKKLQITHPSFLPLTVNFADYGINSVKGKLTYVLTVVIPGSSVQPTSDLGGNYLVLTVKPANAVVTIDGKPLPSESSGEYMKMFNYGSHNYNIALAGYVTKSGIFTIERSRKTELNVALESTFATLTVNCPTEGATIFVDNKSVGTSPWTGSLQDGIYLIEAKKEGYRSARKSVMLAERQKLAVSLDELSPIVGCIDIAYRPIGADIYIDGKKVGTSPLVLSDLPIGSHEVEIKKYGYVAETKNIKIEEDGTTTLQGSLSASSAQTINTPLGSSSNNILTYEVNGVSFEMIKVDGGTFTMGATSEMTGPYDREKPIHQVTLTNSYYIGKTEVTQALWMAVMGNNPSHFKGDNLPVENVSWDDCQQFISKLNTVTGKNYRLPTEAEWEFAARGGNKSKHYQFSGRKKIDDVAWYWKNSGDKHLNGTDNDWDWDKIKKNNCKTHAVATKKPNELGIYDMSGNVGEWCADWYGNYSSSSQTNPTGPNSGSYRVFRGGSWRYDARYCRSSYRYGSGPGYGLSGVGFRLALSQ